MRALKGSSQSRSHSNENSGTAPSDNLGFTSGIRDVMTAQPCGRCVLAGTNPVQGG